MKRKILVLGIINIFLFAGFVSADSICIKNIDDIKGVSGFSKTWIVDDEGDGDFTEIQTAIDNDALNEGDLILVYSGRYSSVDISGHHKEGLRIEGISEELGEGDDTGKPVTSIYMENCYGNKIYNINLRYFSIRGCNNIEFYNNEICTPAVAVILTDSHYNKIYSNEISYSDLPSDTYAEMPSGFVLDLSNNNEINDNTFYDFDVLMRNSNNNTFKCNVMETTKTVGGGNFDMDDSYYNKIIDNIINADIEMWDCDNNDIRGNTVQKDAGIWLDSSCSNTIVGNTVKDSCYGIILQFACDSNLIYHNNIMDLELVDPGASYTFDDGNSNTWYNSTLKQGNYYDCYEKWHRDKYGTHPTPSDDGVTWDTPYIITDYTPYDDSDNLRDNYPLIKPYGKSKSRSVTFYPRILEKLQLLFPDIFQQLQLLLAF